MRPDLGVYLLGSRPADQPWETRWLQWRDFRLPTHPDDVATVLREALRTARHQRVEIACAGGLGRTGTALACLAVLDGLPADQAVAYVRHRYHRKAVETPWQRRFVERFSG